MDLNQVMGELDTLFEEKRTEEIGGFLEERIAQAKAEGAQEIMLTLYNEALSYYRETGQYDKSINTCNSAMDLADQMGLKGTIPYATTLLNVANAHRAAGLLQESLEYYNRALAVYEIQLAPDDMYFAGLYNNISLLYQEMGDFRSAKDQLLKALNIVIKKENTQFEVAVTHANLANTCIELGEDDEAAMRAEEAIRIFEEIGVDDAHYSAALSALGSIYYMDKKYEDACAVMEKSRDCVAKYLGTDNIQYQRLNENIAIIREKLGKPTEVKKAGIKIVPIKENASKTENAVQTEGVPQSEHTASTENAAGEADAENVEEKIDTAEDASGKIDAAENASEKIDAVKNASGEAENVAEEADAAENASEKIDAVKNAAEEADAAENAAEEADTAAREAGTAAREADTAEGADTAKEAGTAAREADIAEKAGTTAEEVSAVENTAQAETTAETEANSQAEDNVQMEGETKDEEEDLTPEITGLELCRKYYEEYGRPMIAEKFSEYETRIAVGLVGKGSDCFGFDDAQSTDHDFGPRFLMWVTKEVYEQIGEELQKAYEQLPASYMDIDRIETFHGRDRAGVMIIEEFYKNVLGYDLIGLIRQCENGESLNTVKCWLTVNDYALSAAVNGEVFRDDEGIFTNYRNRLLAYYPKAVWYRKIAQSCAVFSQNGQYNLPRMRRRGQLVAAELAKAECMKQAMKLNYLFNRKYAPHDKWLFKGMPDNPVMVIEDTGNEKQSVADLVQKMCLIPVTKAHEKELTTIIESLAVIFANALERLNMIGTSNVYLDANTNELAIKSDALLTAIVANTPLITGLSLSIAKEEFAAFDKVQNQGGRASCQNDWPTFKVMRMSQYMTWSEDMLLQYLYEFKTNFVNGRNMIEEKYARMMASTAPDEYERFARQLPPLSEKKQAIIEEIVSVQVKWMEEFAKNYPNLAGNARTIHTSEDLPYDTSYETYLRGELGTYSDKMLALYGSYIVAHAQAGKNVAQEIMENTIHFYGYEDLATANEKGI